MDFQAVNTNNVDIPVQKKEHKYSLLDIECSKKRRVGREREKRVPLDRINEERDLTHVYMEKGVNVGVGVASESEK